jgi:hypothetical protein
VTGDPTTLSSANLQLTEPGEGNFKRKLSKREKKELKKKEKEAKAKVGASCHSTPHEPLHAHLNPFKEQSLCLYKLLQCHVLD